METFVVSRWRDMIDEKGSTSLEHEMTYRGTVKDGIVVLETDSPPPEGTRVTIEVELPAEQESLGQMLLRYAGCAEGLPADLAAEHDHYIHGTPKRSENLAE